MGTSTADQPLAAASILAGLREGLRRQQGRVAEWSDGVPRAAVALILRLRRAGLEILLIKRAEREGDPWSGHVALPGGREEPSDQSLEETALRETKEEIGLDLAHVGEVIGTLDDLEPRSTPRSILVRPFVVALHDDLPLALSDEVAAAFWVPLAELTAPGAIAESTVSVGGAERRVTSFLHGDYVVWGMTERILKQLLARL